MVFDPSKVQEEALIPNFSNPVFWSADQETKSGIGKVSFFQNDDKSTFTISVVARTADGRFGFATKEYEVK